MQKQSFFEENNIIFASSASADTKPLLHDEKDFALPKDTTPFLHYHNKIEVGICTSGLGIFYGNDFAESVKEGDIVLFFPGCAHYSRSVDENTCMCRFAYLEPQLLIFNYFENNEYATNIFKNALCYKLPAVIRKCEYPDIYNILRSMLDDLFAQTGKKSEFLCTLKLCELLLKIPDHFKKTIKKRNVAPPPDNPITRAESFISSHYYENITVEKLCDVCFLSASQLRRRFKAIYGTSPMQYLKKLRCTIAARLLLQTDLPIGEISARVGYMDVSVFYRHFVNIYDVSPSEYKKQL